MSVTSSQIWIAIAIDGALILIALQMLFLLTLRSALERCAPQNRAMSPGQVWLVFVPFFNIVWQFLMVSRVAQSLQREYEARQIPPELAHEDYGKNIGTTMCGLSLASVIPILGIFTGVAACVCWAIYWAKIARFGRKLEELSPIVAHEPQQPLNPAAGWLVLLAAVVGVAGGVLPSIMRSVAIPQMRQDLHLSAAEVGSSFTIIGYCLMAGYVLFGLVTALCGARLTFLISLIGVALSAAVAALASDYSGMIGAFAAASLFGGGLLPAAIVAIRQWLPPSVRPLGVGLVLAGQLMPGILLRPVFGLFGAASSWRIMLFVSSVPVLVALVVCLLAWTAAPPVPGSISSPKGAAGAACMLAIGLLLTAPVSSFLSTGLNRFAVMALDMRFGQTEAARTAYSAAAFFGALAAGAVAWLMQSAGMSASRSRAILLTVCGAALPLVALTSQISLWPLIVLLVALLALAYFAWMTLLYSTVADALPTASVGVAIALGAVSAHLSGTLSFDLMTRAYGFGSALVVVGLLAAVGLAVVAVIAWRGGSAYTKSEAT